MSNFLRPFVFICGKLTHYQSSDAINYLNFFGFEKLTPTVSFYGDYGTGAGSSSWSNNVKQNESWLISIFFNLLWCSKKYKD
jgi:hypothetical protein